MCRAHFGGGLGVFIRAAKAAAGLGVAACWARCTITADMDTVDTTADATIASIITLVTCMHSWTREARARACGRAISLHLSRCSSRCVPAA